MKKICAVAAFLCCNELLAFQVLPGALCKNARGRVSVSNTMARDFGASNESSDNFLLEEFCIHTGEIVDPYKTLKVSRDSQRKEVRQAYLALSKRYHPDAVRHKNILPGKCNNDDEVREEWERIKLSYEILSDKKTRQRYDRHDMLADPQAALGRAAVSAVGNGIIGLGQGLFSVGSQALKKLGKDDRQNQ